MWVPETVVIVCTAFLLAGLVKGVVGLGLPTVSLALLAATLGLTEAIALMLIPSFVTNLWQGLAGRALAVVVRRLWVFLLAAFIGAWIGASVLAQADTVLLSGLLGIMICLYAGISLATPQIPPPGRWEPWMSPVVGGATGVVTGLTGSFVPGVLYLQALALPRDVLIQAMGVAFTAATVALATAFTRYELLSLELGVLSALALAPALLGMAIGRRARRQLSEARFRRVLFGALLLLGVYIAGRAFL